MTLARRLNLLELERDRRSSASWEALGIPHFLWAVMDPARRAAGEPDLEGLLAELEPWERAHPLVAVRRCA